MVEYTYLVTGGNGEYALLDKLPIEIKLDSEIQSMQVYKDGKNLHLKPEFNASVRSIDELVNEHAELSSIDVDGKVALSQDDEYRSIFFDELDKGIVEYTLTSDITPYESLFIHLTSQRGG